MWRKLRALLRTSRNQSFRAAVPPRSFLSAKWLSTSSLAPPQHIRTIDTAPLFFGRQVHFLLTRMRKRVFMTFYRCDNIQCGREFLLATNVIWIADRYTVCCESCKSQFLADNAPLIEQHLQILGLDVPKTRDALLKIAAMVL